MATSTSTSTSTSGKDDNQEDDKELVVEDEDEDDEDEDEDEYDEDEDEDEDDIAMNPTTGNNYNEDDPTLLYTSSMGKLITRLKIVSITSCVLSIVGLPTFIYLKTGTWPNLRQSALGGVAFMGATGSTLALHFVFGPYILYLRRLTTGTGTGSDGDGDSDSTTTNKDDENNNNNDNNNVVLFKATTRSIFGWQTEYVFDPLKDITPYSGIRPFANFVAKGDVTLYAHPELLDDATRLLLLHPKTTTIIDESSSTSTSTTTTATAPETTISKTNHKKQQQKDKQDDDDGFVL
jgi:hypothetical protein